MQTAVKAHGPILGCSTVVVEDCTISDNVATVGGGAGLTIVLGSIDGALAGSGGSSSGGKNAPAAFANNTGPAWGGTRVLVNRTRFQGNTLVNEHAHGAAVAIGGAIDTTFAATTFKGNTGATLGGAASIAGGSVQFTEGTTFESNTAVGKVGADLSLVGVRASIDGSVLFSDSSAGSDIVCSTSSIAFCSGGSSLARDREVTCNACTITGVDGKSICQNPTDPGAEITVAGGPGKDKCAETPTNAATFCAAVGEPPRNWTESSVVDGGGCEDSGGGGTVVVVSSCTALGKVCCAACASTDGEGAGGSSGPSPNSDGGGLRASPSPSASSSGGGGGGSGSSGSGGNGSGGNGSGGGTGGGPGTPSGCAPSLPSDELPWWVYLLIAVAALEFGMLLMFTWAWCEQREKTHLWRARASEAAAGPFAGTASPTSRWENSGGRGDTESRETEMRPMVDNPIRNHRSDGDGGGLGGSGGSGNRDDPSNDGSGWDMRPSMTSDRAPSFDGSDLGAGDSEGDSNGGAPARPTRPAPDNSPLKEQRGLTADFSSRPLPALPPGWAEHTDESTGTAYYAHAATRATSWDRPTLAPPPMPPPRSRGVEGKSSAVVSTEDVEKE